MTDEEAWILGVFRQMTSDKKNYGHINIVIQAGEVVHLHVGADHKPPKKSGVRRVVR